MKKRIQSLDIVRGIAAASVLFTHLGNNISEASIFHSVVNFLLELQRYLLWCNGGLHWGVVVFIVLSGFCIHMPSAKNGITSIIIPYYGRRRFFRIYPVLTMATLIGLLVYSIENGFNASYLINSILNLSLLSGIIQLQGPFGNEILLTVIVECLLYAIYPFCLPKNKHQWIFLFVVALIIYFLNFGLLSFSVIDPIWIQRNLFSFMLYWWIGAFFAETTFNREWNIKLESNFKIVLIIYVVYVLCSNLIDFKGSHIFKSLYLALMTGYLLYWATSIENISNNKFKYRKFLLPMTELGTYSYSLYVLHRPIINFINYIVIYSTFKNTFLFYIMNIIAVIIGTLLFYHSVEKPSHKYAIISSEKALNLSLRTSQK